MTSEKLIDDIKNFVLTDKENKFALTNECFFDEPVIRFTSPDNHLFNDYKTIIGSEHLTPKEAFEKEFGAGTFTDGTVISVVLPINSKTRESNRSQKDVPSKEWVLHRSFGDGVMINKTGFFMEKWFASVNHKAIAPYGAAWFKTVKTATGQSSIWSERHIAYAAGQGTFSLNDALITEKGIAVRLISAVTDLVLDIDTDTDIDTVDVGLQDTNGAKNYRSHCLFYGKNKCRACIKRCPVNAITENGHDKMKCYKYCYGEEAGKIAVSFGGVAKNGSGCGFCQTGVPCEYKIPFVSESAPPL